MLERLIAIQVRDRLDNAEMGRRLGVGPSRWSALRNGLQPWSERLELRAARAFPEIGIGLAEELLSVHGGGAATLTERAPR